LDTLSEFAVAARYDDPAWAAQHATKTGSARWIARSEKFLLSLLP
jgi:hypothetical protein